MRTTSPLGTAIWLLLLLVKVVRPLSGQAITPDEARALAEEAYIYAYPMIEHYGTLYTRAVDKASPSYRAPFNSMVHTKELAGPRTTDAAPNPDVLESSVWIDLRTGPFVLKIPEVKDRRFYDFQLIDLYTHVFAWVDPRITNYGAGTYLIAGPRWTDEVPKEVTRAFVSEGSFVLVTGRVSVRGEPDLAKATLLQSQCQIMPLHAFLGRPAPKPAPAIDFPPFDSGRAASVDFIPYLNFILSHTNPKIEDEPALERFARIGIGPGQESHPERLSLEVRRALAEGIAEARKKIEAGAAASGTMRNGWTVRGNVFGPRKRLQGRELTRAAAAMNALHGNLIEHELVATGFADADGGPLDGSKHDYVIRLARDKFPPVHAFWSITLYTLPGKMLFENPLRRYAIGDRTEGRQFDADGALTLHVQQASPGKAREANWLPAPAGPFYLVARLYWPAPEALAEPYTPPPVVKTR